MAVSKIAVIALVAVIAVPILLGYGMNFEQDTEYRWVTQGDSTNVTQLLESGTTYTYTQANSYSLNTDNFANDLTNNYHQTTLSLPTYLKYTSTKTSFPLLSGYFPLSPVNDLTTLTFMLVSNPALGLIATIDYYDSNGNSQSRTFNDCTYVFYDYIKNTIDVVNYNNGKIYTTLNNPYRLSFSGTPITNPHDPFIAWAYRNDTSNVSYIDISGGWKFPWYSLSYSSNYYSPNYNYWLSPGLASEILITLNLSSHHSSEHDTFFKILTDQNDVSRVLTFNNTYSGGNYTWTVNGQEIIYDNTNSSNNCYQILINRTGAELRYIGTWPDTFGAANVYRTYTFDWGTPIAADEFIKGFSTSRDNSGSSAPTTIPMRVDSALTLATTYNTITNATYDPANITGYQSMETSLNDLYSAGTSLSFGGNLYVVTNNDITISGHKIPLNGMKLSSTLNENGNYDNRINGMIISTTSAQSTITFNGQWIGLSVSSKEMVSESYTTNKWIAGEFAWDGIDSNFLIVGLVTCLGVFIALGIYARKSRSGGIIPLMIVTGCAAAVFFIML